MTAVDQRLTGRPPARIASQSGPSSKPRAYANLELLRFIAALAIVVHHVHMFTSAGYGTAYVPVTEYSRVAPFGEVLWPFYDLGPFGVQFFWLLSGFIFFSQYADRIRTRQISGWRFAVLRFSRLYPLHLVTLLAALGLQFAYMHFATRQHTFVVPAPKPEDIVAQLTMTSAWYDVPPGLNAPVWTVSLEVFAYVTFFLLLRWLPKVALTAAAIAPLLLAWANVPAPTRLLQCLILFYCGGAVWLLERFLRRQGSRRGLHATVAASALVAGGVVIWLASIKASGQTLWFPGRDLPLELGAVATLLAAALAPQLGGWAGRVARTLGETTYASYLIHFPVLLAIATAYAALQLPIPWEEPGLVLVYLGFVYCLSAVAYRRFERPVQDWLRERLAEPPAVLGRMGQAALGRRKAAPGLRGTALGSSTGASRI